MFSSVDIQDCTADDRERKGCAYDLYCTCMYVGYADRDHDRHLDFMDMYYCICNSYIQYAIYSARWMVLGRISAFLYVMYGTLHLSSVAMWLSNTVRTSHVCMYIFLVYLSTRSTEYMYCIRKDRHSSIKAASIAHTYQKFSRHTYYVASLACRCLIPIAIPYNVCTVGLVCTIWMSQIRVKTGPSNNGTCCAYSTA